jgi:hypothetical protein
MGLPKHRLSRVFVSPMTRDCNRTCLGFLVLGSQRSENRFAPQQMICNREHSVNEEICTGLLYRGTVCCGRL